MNILLLNGSSKKNGITSKFSEQLQNKLENVDIINTRDLANAGFCNDCDYCKKHSKCFKNDDVSEILNKIIDADVLFVATPIYFETFPASLKLLVDRMQPLYYNVSSEAYKIKEKKCYTILLAGRDRAGQFEHIRKMLNIIYRQLNGHKMGEILISNTDIAEVDINDYDEYFEKIKKEINEV